jgi:hypothetical protein
MKKTKLPPELELQFLKIFELMKAGVDNVFLYDPEQPDKVWHESDPSAIYDKAKLEEVIDLMGWEMVFFLPTNGRDNYKQ